MDPVITEKVIRSVAASDFTAEDILCGREYRIAGKPVRRPITVYLRFPEHRLQAHAPLIQLIASSLLDECMALYDDREGRGCIPTLWLFDEAGNSPIPSLQRFASTVAGRNMTLVVMVQDHNQLHSAFGRHDTLSIINNMQTQLYYEQSGLETLEYVERRLAKQSVFAHSKTIHENHETAEGQSEQAAPLMTLQELSELQNEVIGLKQGRKPFLITRVDWRQFPHLVQRKEIPPPELPQLVPISENLPALSSHEYVDLDQGY